MWPLLVGGWAVGIGLALSGCADETPRAGSLPPPAPWTPPRTTIPREFVDATAFLLAHGLGDPRGGRFSKVTVPSHDSWRGGGTPVPTEGWLLTGTETGPTRLVGVDGLVHAPLSVSGDSDLRAYVNAPHRSDGRTFRLHSDRALLVALLLIRGEVPLAEKTYAQLDHSNHREPFIRLANAYLTARFHRAVAAHMRGDDILTLTDAAALLRERAAFEAEGQRVLGEEWVRRMAQPNMGGNGTPAVFGYLQPLDALVADSERRIAEGGRAALDLNTLKVLSPGQRVERLIAALDEVKARQWGQPGGVNLVEDPVVAALIREGDVAVEPLLDAMESDRRLTRSVSFGRDFFPNRNLISVRDAAYAAFRAIVQVDHFGPPGQPLDVTVLREFWARNRGLSPAGRWMRTLADDAAGDRRWLEAAERLVEPVTLRRHGHWVSTAPTRPGDPPPAMKGEPLRTRRDPSVADLLAKRARELARVGSPEPTAQGFELYYGLKLAQRLAKWDPRAALPTLQAVSRRAMKVTAAQPHYGSNLGQIGRDLIEVIEKRKELGDPAVLTEYAAWIVKPELRGGGSDEAIVYEPLIRYADQPEMRAAARKLFLDESSPMNLARIAKELPGWNHAESLAVSPLLALAPVRESVEKVLADKTVVGKSWVQGRSIMTSNRNGTTGRGPGTDPNPRPDPLAPPPGEKRDYRICDSMAVALSRLKGAPKVQPYWPTREKDRAIAQMIAYLRQNARRIEGIVPWPHSWKRSPQSE